MSTDKEQATRLADALTKPRDWLPYYGVPWHPQVHVVDEAAAMLRRWPDGEPFGPIYCVGNKVAHAYFWRRSDAEAFASTAGASVGLHVLEVQVMGKPPDAAAPPDQSERIAALEAELELRRKSGSASERLHNLCESIREEADGSAFSREEWNRIDAENLAMRKRIAALEAEVADNESAVRVWRGRTERAEAALKQARAALEAIKRDHYMHWPMKDVQLVNAALRAIEAVQHD